MTKWTDPLRAYDEECDVIEEIREEYGSYLRLVFESFSARVTARIGAEWKGMCKGDGPKTTWFAQPRKVGIGAWTPGGWGGPKGQIAVGVSLDVRAGFSVEAGAARRSLFMEAAHADTSGEVPGIAPDPALLGSLDASYVRAITVPLDTNSADAIDRQAIALADLAGALDLLVTRCTWLESALKSTAAIQPPVESKDVAWEAPGELKRWAAGWYIQLDQKAPEHTVWVCARPPGTLILGHNEGASLDAKLQEGIGAKAFRIDGEHADVAAIQKRALEALALFFRLVQ